LIHALRQTGCEIDEGVQNLKEFSTETVVEATVRCLQLIRPGLELSLHLPPSVSARFKVGTTLAETCKELGYPGEIGFQTFLYSGESDIRKVFIFLTEKLPKDAEKTVDGPVGASALLGRSISATLSRQLNTPWLPPAFKPDGIRWRDGSWSRESYKQTGSFHTVPLSVPNNYSDKVSLPKDVKRYYQDHLPPVVCQSSSCLKLTSSILERDTLSSFIQHEWENEWSHNGLPARLSIQEYKHRKQQKIQKRIGDALQHELQKQEAEGATLQTDLSQILDRFSESQGKGSRFTHSKTLQFKQENANSVPISDPVVSLRSEQTAEGQRQKEEELEQSRTQLSNVTNRLEGLQLDVRTMSASVQQMQEQLENYEQQNKEGTDVYRVKKQTLALLPDAESNLTKLQEVIDNSSQRLLSLATQWEKHRLPLIEQYRHMRQLNASRVSETQRKLEEIRAIHTKIKELAGDARTKEDLHKQLVSEYERTMKDINRSAYTRRIMEIVANIKKQKQDIDKVIIDTKLVQKDINQLTGKLDRTFTVTDELIFRDAKKDEAVRKAYKYLAALHDSCSQLIHTVEETGAIMREIRDLEDQLENEGQKKVVANLERIMADYKQMKQENETLVVQLKEKLANNHN